MNCISNNTELYGWWEVISSVLIMRKGESTPLYDESIVVRGYDYVEYVNRIRFSGKLPLSILDRFQVWDVVRWVFLPSSWSGVIVERLCHIVWTRILSFKTNRFGRSGHSMRSCARPIPGKTTWIQPFSVPRWSQPCIRGSASDGISGWRRRRWTVSFIRRLQWKKWTECN